MILRTATVVVCALAFSTAAFEAQESGRPVAGEGQRAVAGIVGTTDVHNLLDRVRDALGGRERLMKLRSLTLTGTRTSPNRDPQPFTYRILLPDQFQRVEHGITFTLTSKGYWQRPDPGEAAKSAARVSTSNLFVEACLARLILSPTSLPVHARIMNGAAGRIVVGFTNDQGLELSLDIDSDSHLPLAYSRVQKVTQGSTVVGTATRRVSFDAFERFAGISMPIRMTETTEGGMRSTALIAVTEVKVNGLLPAAFEER